MGDRQAPEPLGHLQAPDWFKQHLGRVRLEKMWGDYAERLKLLTNLATKRAYEVNKELPRDVKFLEGLLDDKNVPLQVKAKILEVMILRGASSHSNPQLKTLDRGADVILSLDGQTRQSPIYNEINSYQFASMLAVMNGGPKLFEQLSRSPDNLPHPPSGRPPATEWMNTMFRQDGLLDDHHARTKFAASINALPPETRGHAMFHLSNAGGVAKDYDERFRFNGVEVSIGPIGAGGQGERSPDTHWDRTINHVDRQVLGALKPEESAAFAKGFREAKMARPE